MSRPSFDSRVATAESTAAILLYFVLSIALASAIILIASVVFAGLYSILSSQYLSVATAASISFCLEIEQLICAFRLHGLGIIRTVEFQGVYRVFKKKRISVNR